MTHSKGTARRTNGEAGLKHTISGEGVWRIRKREKVPMIEVFMIEENGHGSILSKSFLDWRASAKL